MRFDSLRHGLVGVLLALAFAAPAAAQEMSSVPDHLIGMVGDWRLEQEDPALPFCPLLFTEDETEGGWIVNVPEPCGAPYPAASSIAVWNVDDNDGSVVLLDAAGALTLRLYEGEDGLFQTGADVTPPLYLVIPWDEGGTGGEVGDEF